MIFEQIQPLLCIKMAVSIANFSQMCYAGEIMTTTIFGRDQEIKTLKRLLNSTKAEFLAIYGRRRVGKTYLIHEFFKDKGAYFCVTGSLNSTKRLQIKQFHRELQAKFHLSEKAPTDWDDALYALKEAISKIDPTQKIIIFSTNSHGLLPTVRDSCPPLNTLGINIFLA